MWISSKGLNSAFKSIPPHGGLDLTENDLNIFSNLNKTFPSDFLEGETVSVYWENRTRTTIPQLWKEFSLLGCEGKTRCLSGTYAAPSFPSWFSFSINANWYKLRQ
jgi:hypothetical protein